MIFFLVFPVLDSSMVVLVGGNQNVYIKIPEIQKEKKLR